MKSLSAVRHYTLEELQRKQEKAAQRQALLAESAKRAAARQKALMKKIAKQETDEKNRRLLHYGEMLESHIENSSSLTDAQLEEILKIALGQPTVRDVIAKMQDSATSAPITTMTAKEESLNERTGKAREAER